jgi:ribosome-associated translation inhibitor RaiA
MTSQSHRIETNVANHDLIYYAQNNLESLLEKAPSDSFVKLTINTAKNGTEVMIDLCSNALKYFAKDVAKSPYMAVEKAMEHLRARLRNWQVTKFDQ